jgi:hypothetical protein
MNCPHLESGVCHVASSLVGAAIEPQPAACVACATCKNPQAINKVTVGLAMAELMRQGKCTKNLIASHGRHLRERVPFPLRAISYAMALTKWMASGLPVRSEAEVGRIYNEICGPCELREPTSQPEVSYCGGGCNCCLSSDPGVTNKIFLETEHCPKGKW